MNKTYKLIFLFFLIISCNINKIESSTKEEKQQHTKTKDNTPKVTGIGGIFFKAKNPSELNKWYGENLGLTVDDYGSPFEFRNADRPDEINYLNWDTFEDSTSYFNPSEKDFMINYRVQNIEGLVDKLKKNGAIIVDEISEYEYGKFIHIMDTEGNKIELWEPVDSVLTKMGRKTTKWKLLIDGPLLSMNFSFCGDGYSFTPMLIGFENEILKEPEIRQIVQEGVMAMDLISKLDKTQIDKMTINNVWTGKLHFGFIENLTILPTGLSLSELKNKDQATFFQLLLLLFTTRLDRSLSKDAYKRITEKNLEKTKMILKGGSSSTDELYLTVSSPSFLIEYVQRDIDGIHRKRNSIFRELNCDYGKQFDGNID